jgi:carbonic anhydrase
VPIEAEIEPNFRLKLHYNPFGGITLQEVKYSVALSGIEMGMIELTDLNGMGPFVYKVNNIHFHTRSEHLIKGHHADLEMHIVHELVDGPEEFKGAYS